MSARDCDRPNLTWQQLLAAYADGELDAAGRRQVEAQLAASPEATAELRGQRRFSSANVGLWRQVEPPVPVEEQWDRVWRNIEAGRRPAAEPVRRSGPSRWWRRGLLPVALTLPTTAAASVALVLSVGPAARPPITAVEDDSEVYPVVQPDDLVIDSLRHADRGSLVVGEPPLSDMMSLASATDVTLDSIQPDRDGVPPQMMTDDMAAFGPAPRDP